LINHFFSPSTRPGFDFFNDTIFRDEPKPTKPMKYLATRRKFVKTLSLLSVAPSVLYRNTFGKEAMPRIGFLSGTGVMNLEKAFTEELQTLGFTEGQNIHIEIRLARSGTTDAAVMAAELSQMDLSLIVAGALPFALEVRKANPKMPIVIATCPGIVSNGFAKTLEKPGGIYTGMDELPEGVTTKRLQLLHAVVPDAKRIALLSTTPGVGGHETQLADAEKTAAGLGIEVKAYRAASLSELEKALAALTSDGMNGMLCFQGGLSLANREMIVAFITKNRIPAIYQATIFTEVGGLMAWAPDLPKQFREAAHYVDKILKGAKPGDLPVKQPEKYYLTLNKAAASKIGISFPKGLLAEANKVIE
jgi:putative ABC transport system substrate-binding protein